VYNSVKALNTQQHTNDTQTAKRIFNNNEERKTEVENEELEQNLTTS